jgi:DNA-binding GntR family transcriptional regulator
MRSMKPEVSDFTEMTVESVESRAAHILREAIIRGELPTGPLLHVREVADKLGISSTPVLGALKRLESEGYVTVMPRRGFQAREMTFEDLEEVMVVRAALEGYGVRKGLEKATPETIETMAEIVARIDSLLANPSPSADVSAQVADLDAAFHLELIRAVGRPSLVEKVNSYRHRSRAYMTLSHLHIMPQMNVSQDTHHEILSACRQADGTRLEMLTRQHILRTVEVLAPVLRSTTPPTDSRDR